MLRSTTHRAALTLLPNSHSSLFHNQSSIFHPPDASLLLSLLHRCSSLRHLKQIHAQMVVSDLISFPFAAGRLVAFCALSDTPDLPYCVAVLRNLCNPNAFAWNVAIRGYSDSDDPKESILLYKDMLRSSARPDNRTFPFLFKACSKMSGWFWTGNSVLGHVVQLGLISDPFVFNSGIHMFAVCGGPENARKLFDESCVRDLVSWNTLINVYVQCGKPREGLRLFREMEAAGIRPDEVTMIGLVSCCTQLQDLELGRKFHQYVEENELDFTVPLTNALMDMYVKCASLEPAEILFHGMKNRTVISWTTMIVGYAKFGLLDAARRAFDEMPEKDVVPWNALIAGYVQCRRGKEALALFHEMQTSDVKPNEVTMVSLLSACTQLGALDMGLWIHHYIEKQNFSLSVALGTALVDMYAKCGKIKKSLQVFKEIPERNALTWTSIICGLASHGCARDAIEHLHRMTEIGLAPDDVTLLGVLSACCHAGLVDEGRKYFSQMSSVYKLSPKIKHYSCIVDLLGRAGLLNEALEVVRTMHIEPDAAVWGALFFACRIHRHVSIGEYAARRLLELDPHDSGTYVLLANMYAEADMRDEADKVWKLMKHKGVEKTPGCSSIEVDGMVHEFIVRDKSHQEWKDIYACLTQLAKQMDCDRTMADLYQIGCA